MPRSKAPAPSSLPPVVDPVVATVGLTEVPTPLSARLDTHPDARRAFDLARELFIGGERIDMGGLASRLGIDRTSLFRWVGNRDALLSEVLWSIAVPTLVRADRATAHFTGADQLAEFLARFAADLIGAENFQDFLRREPSRALKLLTTNASSIQRRFQLTVQHLIVRQLGERPLNGAIDPATLAYLLIRVWESFTYADLIAGEDPSAVRARTAFRVVLRIDDSAGAGLVTTS